MASGGHVDGAGQRRGGQRVEHADRPGTGIDAAAASTRPSAAPKALSTSTPSRDAQLPCGRLAEPEPDPHRGARRRSSSPAATGSSSPTTATRPSSARALSRGVGVHRAVPVEVVLGDVEHHARLRPQRRRPVQLEARQLDGEQLGAARPSTSSTGLPMLPHSTARRPAATSIACSIDVVVVLPLVPVTTSQRRGGPYQPRLVQPPRQFDVAPDRHARGGRGGQHRRGRAAIRGW